MTCMTFASKRDTYKLQVNHLHKHPDFRILVKFPTHFEMLINVLKSPSN